MSPAHTRIQCPGTWAPWDRYDPRSVKRGDWHLRWMPLPVYAYVAAHQIHGFQVIPAFYPYLTAPTHHKVWDEVLKRVQR